MQTDPTLVRQFRCAVWFESLVFVGKASFCCTFIKASEYTLRGSNCIIFVFGSLLNRGYLFKERICSFRSKFFPLTVDLVLEELYCPEKQTESYDSCSPL